MDPNGNFMQYSLQPQASYNNFVPPPTQGCFEMVGGVGAGQQSLHLQQHQEFVASSQAQGHPPLPGGLVGLPPTTISMVSDFNNHQQQALVPAHQFMQQLPATVGDDQQQQQQLVGGMYDKGAVERAFAASGHCATIFHGYAPLQDASNYYVCIHLNELNKL
jgi:hypothetical protein